MFNATSKSFIWFFNRFEILLNDSLRFFSLYFILRAFDAAVINREHRLDGIDEEIYKINVKDSCDIPQEEQN